jgi:hypothetical protein
MTKIDLFGPLGKDYCVYFYILSVISLISFAIIIVRLLLSLLSKKRGEKGETVVMLFAAMNSLLIYFLNRLFHTMCVNSIKNK